MTVRSVVRSDPLTLGGFLREHCGSLREAFSLLDVQSAGALTKDQFIEGLRRLSYSGDALVVFDEMDKQKSGSINLRDFIVYFTSRSDPRQERPTSPISPANGLREDVLMAGKRMDAGGIQKGVVTAVKRHPDHIEAELAEVREEMLKIQTEGRNQQLAVLQAVQSRPVLADVAGMVRTEMERFISDIVVRVEGKLEKNFQGQFSSMSAINNKLEDVGLRLADTEAVVAQFADAPLPRRNEGAASQEEVARGLLAVTRGLEVVEKGLEEERQLRKEGMSTLTKHVNEMLNTAAVRMRDELSSLQRDVSNPKISEIDDDQQAGMISDLKSAIEGNRLRIDTVQQNVTLTEKKFDIFADRVMDGLKEVMAAIDEKPSEPVNFQSSYALHDSDSVSSAQVETALSRQLSPTLASEPSAADEFASQSQWYGHVDNADDSTQTANLETTMPSDLSPAPLARQTSSVDAVVDAVAQHLSRHIHDLRGQRDESVDQVEPRSLGPSSDAVRLRSVARQEVSVSKSNQAEIDAKAVRRLGPPMSLSAVPAVSHVSLQEVQSSKQTLSAVPPCCGSSPALSIRQTLPNSMKMQPRAPTPVNASRDVVVPQGVASSHSSFSAPSGRPQAGESSSFSAPSGWPQVGESQARHLGLKFPPRVTPQSPALMGQSLTAPIGQPDTSPRTRPGSFALQFETRERARMIREPSPTAYESQGQPRTLVNDRSRIIRETSPSAHETQGQSRLLVSDRNKLMRDPVLGSREHSQDKYPAPVQSRSLANLHSGAVRQHSVGPSELAMSAHPMLPGSFHGWSSLSRTVSTPALQ
jgi:hypothetical protein